MKTGKTIVRVLAVILLLSMLVGFTPAMPAASQDDGGAVVLADPVEGEDNGGATPGETEGGNTGSGDTGDAPGETGGGTNPGEGSDTNPGEGGSTEPEIKKVAVTFDGNVTVMAGDAALESGAEVEVGTELAITVKTANVASAILVNGKECKGQYTVSDTDEAVNITAFGITATKVEPDGWTKGDKTLTVNTFGENVTVNGTASNGKVTFTQSENGTFTAVAKCGDASVTVPVNIEQIDKDAPAFTEITKVADSSSWSKKNYMKWTIKLEDEGVGIDPDSIKITGTYYYGPITGSPTFDVTEGDEFEYEYKDGVITFTAPAYEYNWRNKTTEVTYSFEAKDKLGNTLSAADLDNIGVKPPVIYHKDDSVSPELTGTKVMNPVDKVGGNWVGPNSKVEVTGFDTKKSGERDPFGVKAISLNKDDESLKEINLEYGQNSSDAVTVTFDGTDFKDGGTFQFVAKDYKDHPSEPIDLTLRYDDQAPTITSLYPDARSQTVFENIVHALSGGIMCKEKVRVFFTTDEVGSDCSGLQMAYYQFTGQEGFTPAEIHFDEAAGKNYFIAEIPGGVDRTNKDKISVYFMDNVGNQGDGAKVAVVSYSEEQPEMEAVFDTTGTNVNGKLTVFAYTPSGEDEQTPYIAVQKDKENWVTNVEFDVRYDVDELREAEAKTKPDGALTEDSEWCEVTYNGISLTVDVEGDFDDSAKPEVSEQKDADGNTVRGAWNVKYGVNGKVACDGILTFVVKPKATIRYMGTKEITKTEQIKVADSEGRQPGTEGYVDTYETSTTISYDSVVKEEKTLEGASISVPVKVQNFIEPAVITVDGTTTQDGWFNGLDPHQLKEVTVTAPQSKAPFKTAYELIYAPISGKESSKLGDEITDSGKDANLRSQVDQDGLYKVVAVTKDTVGLGLSAETKDVSFKYDETPANIYVTFATEQESHKDANGKFYDEQRTARVTIIDDTFTDEKNEPAKDFDQFVVEILKTYGAEPEILKDWTFTPADGGKGGTWTRTYTYGVKSSDVKRDGDNYQVTVAVTDKAGNTSATDKQGAYTKNNKTEEKEPSHYTSANGELFTVDQTAPVVSVSFNNNNVRNGKYFNAARTATITVVEHNFDPARVTLVATGASAGAAAAEGWSQNGDTWTKTVTFARDANCKFSIDVVDKAGNVCPNANVKYSGVATEDFVIDLTRPNVQYTGVDASPYAEACTPGFTATDTNLGNEFTYKLTRKTMKGEQDVTNLLNHAGTAARFSYSDIPNSRDDDGIYTFTCSVTDLAGNVTTLNPVEFAVNRHGSVYLLNKELQNVVGKYFNEDGWAKVNDDNLVITEYNPTPLKDDAKLEIYRDGTRVATYTGDALKKLVSGGDRGGLGLYEYAYKLPAADFAEDGSYRVVLSSTDANDHKSGNDKTGAEINFVIDTVSPEIVSISGLEKRTVNAEEQPVGFHILDTYGLDSVAIRTAGPDGAIVKEYISQAKYDAQNGKLEPYQQLLPEGELDLTDEIILIQNNTPYHVVISVTDKAGNTTVADGGSIVSSTEAEAMTPAYDFQDSVTVSTNFFVRYIHNTGALVGTGVGAVAIAGLWLVLAKRRKDDEEKKTA